MFESLSGASSGLNSLWDTVQWLTYQMGRSPFEMAGIPADMEAPTVAMAALGVLYVAVGFLGKMVLTWQRATNDNVRALQGAVSELSREVGNYRTETAQVVDFQREMRSDMQVIREHILYTRTHDAR